MGIRQWFLDLFDKEGTLSLSAVVARLATEVYYKELAVQACANLIAKTLARAEFRTFLKGEEVREDMYYLLNIEPNPNQNASDFWRDAVYRAVTRNEALIIMADNYLYLADSWSVVPGIFVENLYTEIRLGELREPFKRRESEVLHLRMHNEQAKQVIDGLYDSYSKLIAAAQKRYRRNSSKRGFLELGTSYPQTEKAQADLKDLLENRFKTFFQHEDDAVLPLTGGAKWQELETTGPTARGSVEGRDIREFINDVFDFTAVAFQVPPQLLKGNVADTHEAMKNFLTFCINPLADMIGDEINRKMYGKRDFKKRSYVKVDTTHIRAVDIKDVANALDVLFRIGAYTIDDCLKYLGMEPIGGEVGQQRFVTKNYQPIEDVIDGGEVSRIETLAIDRTLNERGESMNRYWQLVVQDKEAALYIYGDIVTEDLKWFESDVSGHELVQRLDQLDVDFINVYINSYGGFVSEAWAIHNALKRQKAKIRTVCEGFACSAASLIFMAGDERIMLDTSALWIHNVQAFAAGDYKKLQSEAEGAKKLNELGMQIYLEHVNLSKEELAEMMDKETWISPTEALEWGFATAIQSGGESKKPTQSARKHIFDMIFKEANRPLTAHVNVQVPSEEQLEEFAKQFLAKLQAQANETEQEGPAPDQEHQDPESKGLFNFLEALASKLSEGDEEK